MYMYLHVRAFLITVFLVTVVKVLTCKIFSKLTSRYETGFWISSLIVGQHQTMIKDNWFRIVFLVLSLL